MNLKFDFKDKSTRLLLSIVLLQITFDLTVLFNITVARYVIGFLYLTFVPGFLVVKLLNLDELDALETVLFSVGFSIATLMLIGLILDELYLLLNISRPLSINPLLIFLNILVLILIVISYIRRSSIESNGTIFGKSHKLALLSSLLIIILSITGVMLVNVSGNNFILLLMIFAISFFVAAILVSVERFSAIFYAFIIFIIALSLLYHSSLISNYLVGFASDSHVEHSVFQKTKNDAYWSVINPYPADTGYGRLYSMLSITILPTIYSILLNIDSAWVFKAIFPFIFALVPFGLFKLWQTYIGKKYAFASIFLFMAQQTFYTEMLGLNRQMIAELFFVLLLIVIFSKRMKSAQKIVCFAMFSFALVTSHYGVAEIFMFIISFALILLIVLRRKLNENITVSMVTLFFVIMFSWYIYTSSSSVFNSLLNFGSYVYEQLGEFFNPASRGQTVLRGLGLESPPTIWNAVSRAFAYFTQALILIGFVGIITKRVKPNFDRETYIFVTVAMVFLIALIVIPGLAETMNMTRFYHSLLFFLAPLFPLGIDVIFSFVLKKPKKTILTFYLILTILIPYFLFQTNFMYEITMTQSWSLPLSMHRLGIRLHTDFALVTEEEVFGAKWLSKYNEIENPALYADFHIFSALVGYGMMREMSTITNVTTPIEGSFIYFGALNTIFGVVIDYDIWNTTEIIDSNMRFASKIYSNGQCEIYKLNSP